MARLKAGIEFIFIMNDRLEFLIVIYQYCKIGVQTVSSVLL